MATLPTLDDLQATLIDIFADFNSGRARPEHGLPWGSILGKWKKAGYRAEDFNRLVDHMVEQSTLMERNGVYLLTEKAVQDGLIELPTNEEVENEVLGCFAELKTRAGEGQMAQVIVPRMQKHGYTGEEINRALEALVGKRFVEQRGNMLILTEAGFAAM